MRDNCLSKNADPMSGDCIGVILYVLQLASAKDLFKPAIGSHSPP